MNTTLVLSISLNVVLALFLCHLLRILNIYIKGTDKIIRVCKKERREVRR